MQQELINLVLKFLIVCGPYAVVFIAVATVMSIVLITRGPRRVGMYLLCAELIPIALVSAYLTAIEWLKVTTTPLIDQLVLFASVIAGAAFVAILPARQLLRVFGGLLYIIVMSCFLLVYSIAFVCYLFHHCL